MSSRAPLVRSALCRLYCSAPSAAETAHRPLRTRSSCRPSIRDRPLHQHRAYTTGTQLRPRATLQRDRPTRYRPSAVAHHHRSRGLATVVAPQRPASPTGPGQYCTTTSFKANAEDLLLQLRSLQNLFDSETGIDNPTWRTRLACTIDSLQHRLTPDERQPLRLLIAGSSLSRTRDLVVSLFDEPLREQATPGRSDADFLIQALSAAESTGGEPSTLTIRYGQGEARWMGTSHITLDRSWLLESNADVTVVIDPASSELFQETVYASDVAFFVTDTYALEHSLARPSSRVSQSTGALDLVSQFASKPNVHVIVNQLTNLQADSYLPALEAALGPAALEQLSQATSSPVLSVSASEATRANAALRGALAGPDVQVSSLLWDEFSSRFTASKVADVHRLVQSLASSRSSSDELTLQSAQVVADHCLSDLVSFCASASASFDRILAASAALQAESLSVQQEANERVWPSTGRRRASSALEKVKSWRPAATGSASAVEDALSETADAIASTLERRLQWWKLIWKVDDVCAELEGVCAGFASSLESTLAYEAGRLATLQAQQVETADRALGELRSLAAQLDALRGTSRDLALFVNAAEAVRSREMKTLTPTTLLEPIEHRREQLLRLGGPIDVLANKARKLAVTTYATLGATGAGLGSASIMGASLGSGPLAMEPATAAALSLLACTAAAWRMQGRFAKIKARFWQDWDRLADGLDHEVKEHLDVVLDRDVVGQNTFIASGLCSLRAKWQRDVAAVEAQVRTLSMRSAAGGAGPGALEQKHSSHIAHETSTDRQG